MTTGPKISWQEIYPVIFKQPAWLIQVKDNGLTPQIVGYDLHELSSKGRAYLALALPMEDPLPEGSKELFFKCLQPHTFNKNTQEVVFENSNVTLSVDAINANEAVEVAKLKALFRETDLGGYRSATTKVVVCEDEGEVTEISPRGAELFFPTSVSNLKDQCAIQMRHGIYGRSIYYYHFFQKPDKPDATLSRIPKFSVLRHRRKLWRLLFRRYLSRSRVQ